MLDFNKRYPEVQKTIKRTLGVVNEDIEQEVYLKALENKDKYTDEGKFVAWLKTIALNLIKDTFKSSHFKAMNKKVDVDDVVLTDKSALNPLDEELRKERQKAILKAVDSLPKKLRQVIYLYEFEELSYNEISEKTGVSVGTIKSRLFNARNILSEKLSYMKGE